MGQFREGSVTFSADEGDINRGMDVFYNPEMKENRDITLAVIDTFTHGVKVALPLAGSGVRGLRILNESHAPVQRLFLNDRSRQAMEQVRANLDANGLTGDDRVSVHNDDAVSFLAQDQGFDYIDIDPFGSPVAFIEPAVRRISRGGIIAATATDTAALCGSSPRAGRRKYWARPLRCDMMHEIGLRILIRRLQLAGTPYARALTPILAYAKDHYMRVFLRSTKGKRRCDDLLSSHVYIIYCPHCLHREVCAFPLLTCPKCGERSDHAGPLWGGPLAGEPDILAGTGQHLIDAVVHESSIDVPFVYDLHAIAKKYGTGDMPRRDTLIARGTERGYRVSVSHHAGHIIRTDAPVDVVASWLTS